ncbi:MAG: hypothetical protein LH478_02685 [Chitinophagaceae bacterium]|nr:hypothetical protein [Chitinophagaceae bacterium]
MLRINFVLLLLLVCTTCFSQSENIWKRKPWEELKFENKQKLSFSNPVPKELNKPVDIVYKTPVLKIEIDLKRVGSIKASIDIFTVEPYHTPCIVPSKDFESKMPVVGIVPKS